MKYIIIIAFLLFTFPSFAQSIPSNYSRNTIFTSINAGGYFESLNSKDEDFAKLGLSISYERLFYVPQDKFISSLKMILNYERFGSVHTDLIGGHGHSFTIGASALSGHGSGHLELGTGLRLVDLVNKGYNINEPILFITPLINIGYRWQCLVKSSFVFRTGIGYPDLLYLSIGYAF